MKRIKQIFLPVFCLIFLFTASSCGSIPGNYEETASDSTNKTEQFETVSQKEAEEIVENLPEYSGERSRFSLIISWVFSLV